jgi:hypothetical protein
MALRIRKGADLITPSEGDVSIIAKDDGSLRVLHPDGTEDAIGGESINGTTIYVHPDGSDDNTGLSWASPVRTGYVGYQKIVDAGGGYLYFADKCYWGGPVTAQGLWVRGDGQAVKGWLPIVPCTFIGIGPGRHFLGGPGSAILYAGSNDAGAYRTMPAVWEACTEIPISFVNLQVKPTPGHEDGQEGCHAAFRIGWDYPRNDDADGTIAYQTIHSAERSGGFAYFTVDLLPAVSIVSASRTGNATTLHIPRPGAAAAPYWKAGSEIWFESTDPAFTSGVYVVASTPATIDFTSDWTIVIADPGPNTGTIDNPGTVRSVYAQLHDKIEVQSHDANFPSIVYISTTASVSDATTGVITCIDPNGGTVAPTADIGQLAIQLRGYNAVCGTRLENCFSHRDNQNYTIADQAKWAPMFDLGAALADSFRLRGIYSEGHYPTTSSGIAPDVTNHSSIFAVGDSIAAPSVIMYDLSGSQAWICADVSATTGYIWIDLVTFDTSSPSGEAPPAYTLSGTSAAIVKLDNIIVADSAPTSGTPSIAGGIPAANITGNSVFGYGGVVFGQKVISASGLGTGLAYEEGVGSGQVTIAGSFSPKKYEPIFKADGTLKGWVELLDGSINP